MASLFGFKISREDEPDSTPSIAQTESDDGSFNILKRLGSSYGYVFDVDGSGFNSDYELIEKYRSMALVSEMEYAIDDVVNEFVSTEQNEQVFIDLDRIDQIGESTKKAINDEFTKILALLNFSNRSYEIIKRWYVDGRWQCLIVTNPDISKIKEEGIKEIKYVDPRKVKKIKLVDQVSSDANNGAILTSVKDQYWMFSDTGFDLRGKPLNQQPTNSPPVQVAKDAIVQITSGITDPTNTMVLSHIHKAIRPLNQVKSLEDASIIYMLSRAPQKRVFYIDIGTLSGAKADQYMSSIISQAKNKVVYNVVDGKINDDRRAQTMIEDLYIPRREGGKGTEVSTLDGDPNATNMDQVTFFKQNLYKALNIPITRLDSASGMMLGRQTEISRDEYKFSLFIARLRRRFSALFIDLLGIQLVLKGLMTPDEWDDIKDLVSFEYAADNLFNEIKESEVLNSRLDLLLKMKEFVGVYFSKDMVQRKVLYQSDEEIEQMKKQIEEEGSAPVDGQESPDNSYNAKFNPEKP